MGVLFRDSCQTVLQRPSRFVTEVPPELFEVWSVEEESALTGAPGAALAEPSAGEGEDDPPEGEGDEPGGYLN